MNKAREIALRDIKAEILNCLNKNGISAKQIILFGSRARGDYSKFSDYDFLIITKKTLAIKEKMRMAKAVRMALAELYIHADVIINSEAEADFKKIR